MWSTETSWPAAFRASCSRDSLSPIRWERSPRSAARNCWSSLRSKGLFGRGFGFSAGMGAFFRIGRTGAGRAAFLAAGRAAFLGAALEEGLPDLRGEVLGLTEVPFRWALR